MKRFAVLFAVVLVLSCRDEQAPPTAPPIGHPQTGIADAVHPLPDGTIVNEHFYWLPELVELPSITGTFNPEISAAIRICEVGGDEEDPPLAHADCDGDNLLLFGPESISVSSELGNEHYMALWHTEEPTGDSPVLDPDKFYRLSVWVGEAIELGYRGLDPEESPPQGADRKLEDYYPYKNGNTINIKFWIGEGALCLGDPDNCGECLYSTSGPDDGNNDNVGRACNANYFAGVYIPPGNPEVDDVWVIPEYIPVGSTVTLPDGRKLTCKDLGNGQVEFIKALDIPQYPGCFTIRTIGDFAGPLTNPAIVGICPAVPDDPEYHPAIHQTPDATNPNAPVWALSPASTEIGGVDFIPCAPPTSPLQNLVRKVWRNLSPFRAEPAYAGHNTLKGGEPVGFSEFAWAVSSQEVKTAGNNQLGFTQTTLPIPLTVYVSDLVPDDYWEDEPVRLTESIAVHGADVTFKLREGDGSDGIGGFSAPNTAGLCDQVTATSLPDMFSVTTGSSGEAKVCLTPPADGGTLHVDASGLGIGVTGRDWTINTLEGAGPYSHYSLDTPLSSKAPIKLPSPPDTVTFTATACEQVAGEIDGVKDDGEWTCAFTRTFTANVSGGKLPATLFWKRVAGDIYFAVQVPVVTAAEKEIKLTLHLNGNEAGTFQRDDDVLVVDGTVEGDQFSDMYLWDRCPKGKSFCALADVDAPEEGTNDGAGKFSINTPNGEEPFYFFEVKHPENSVDPHDIDVRLHLGVSLTLRIGKGRWGNTDYPEFGVYETLY
jgi:hypothetical protein